LKLLYKETFVVLMKRLLVILCNTMQGPNELKATNHIK